MKISDTKKLAAFTAAFFITATAFSGCSESANSSQTTSSVSQAAKSDIDASIAAEDIDVGYDEESSVGITFSDGSAAIDGEGATAEGETVTISQAGTYILSGTATNGRIIVLADKTAEIKLIFNGVDITCADNTPLLVSKAKKVYIVLEDGTENVLTDSASYSLEENDSNTDGAIFSKADLTINGSGTLTVNANYKHGIVSKDDLVITDGNINVTSASTAMEGKDSVKISGGTFNISAGTNGIKSTNTEASDKGFISVTGGSFTVVANNDAFEAKTVLSIESGSFDITTGGGSANASMKSDGTPNSDWHNNMGNGSGGPNGGMGRPDDNGNGMGGEPPAMPTADDTGLTIETAANTTTDSTDTTDSTSTSAKALKAGSEVNISGGEFKIDSADDSVHSNGSIVITGGNISAASGDDGMHASGNLTISDGTVDITKSYEGIEGSIVTIDGGTISVAASDDGINCAGGSDTGSTNRMGADQFSAQEGVELNINGGTVTIDADSDGKEILSFTPTKTWQSVVFTSADLKEGETYTITAGSQSETVTIDGIVTSNSKGKNFGGGHGGRRGF